MGFLVRAVKSVVKAVVGVVSAVVGGVFGVLVGGKKKTPATSSNSRLNKTLNPEDFRKIVFGKTASALDLRYWEVYGTNGTKYDEVIALACHQINSVKEFYAESDLAIDASNTPQGKYAGILTRAFKLGAPGQTALSVGAGGQYTAAAKMTGVAHMVLKWLKNDDKLPNGPPSRYTNIIEGALVYDPRRDSTQPGGSGTHRINDQTTWAYATLDSNSVPIGRNNALQALWYLLGWRVQNPVTGEMVLVAGRGIDPNDINIQTFITGANNCEAAGYYTDMILSTEDEHTSNEDKITADGLIATLIDPGGLWSYCANVDDTASVAVYVTDDDILDTGKVSWNEYKGMSDQFNQVVGKFIDPSATALFQPRAYPMVRDSTYETNLGVKRRKSIDFEQIQDALLAQKLARLSLNQGQFQAEFSANFNYKALKAQAWSIISYTSERFGWTKLFRVYRYAINGATGIGMTLREVHPSIWTAGSVTAPVTAPLGTRYDPSQAIALAGLTAAAMNGTGTDGTIRDGIALSWTTPSSNVRRTEVQIKLNGDTYWQSFGPFKYDVNNIAIFPLMSGSLYNIRARHVTVHEVAGAWATANFTTGTTSNVEASDIITTIGTAAAIVGQGALATQSNVDYTSQVIARPVLTERFYDMNYASIADVQKDIQLSDPSLVSIITTTDTGGKALQFGDNAGDDRFTFFANEFMHYSPDDLYEVSFDIEIVAGDATALLYLGLEARDKAGNNLGGSYQYIAAVGLGQASNLGRQVRRAYIKGYTTSAVGAPGSTPNNPVAMPDGTAYAYGQGGVVKIRPMGICNYPAQTGKVILHSMRLRKITGAAAARDGFAYGDSYLTGFGGLAPRNDVYFGSTYLLESNGGAQATVGNFRTNLGTAAAISGQSSWATYSGLVPTNVAGQVQFLDTGGNLDTITRITNRRLTLLKRADGTTDVTEGAVVTSLGTASGISGQGALATLSSIGYGSGYITSFPSAINPSNMYSGSIGSQWLYDPTSGVLICDRWPAEYGANVTETRVAASITGQGGLATRNNARVGWELVDEAGAYLPPAYIKNNNNSSAGTGFVARPVGGEYTEDSPSLNGAIQIKLPNTIGDGRYCMIKFQVDIFDYNNGTTVTYDIAGYLYPYLPGSGWINCTAKVVGGGNGAVKPVRFGRTGTSSSDSFCVWIGDVSPASTWEYPKVSIRNVVTGYSYYDIAYWQSGWQITRITTAFPLVDIVVSNPTSGDAVFGVNTMEAWNGALATLANFKTGLGTAAGFSGQGALATLNNVNPASSQVLAYGSIPPTIPDNSFTYTSTTSSISISWPAMTVYRADGTSVSISSGSQAVSGLSSSTTYKIYAYVADSGGTTGTISFVAVSGGAGSPGICYSNVGNALAAATMYARGNIPMGGFQASTPASGGSGGGGGGFNCLHPSTLVGERFAGDLQLGDLVPAPCGQARITHLKRKLHSQWIVLESNGVEVCMTTFDHRLYLANGQEVAASDVKLGDLLASKSDHVEITAIRLDKTPAMVVILELDEPHLYYCGELQVLCHNPKP